MPVLILLLRLPTNQVLIPRNSKIPCKFTKKFTTIIDNQPNLRVTLFEGEKPQARDNQLLTDIHITIPRNRRGPAGKEVSVCVCVCVCVVNKHILASNLYTYFCIHPFYLRIHIHPGFVDTFTGRKRVFSPDVLRAGPNTGGACTWQKNVLYRLRVPFFLDCRLRVAENEFPCPSSQYSGEWSE